MNKEFILDPETIDTGISYIFKRIEDMGRAREALKNILENDLFENLSKHNDYWSSEHENEDDKLHDLRLKISFLKDKLWGLDDILTNKRMKNLKDMDKKMAEES